MLEGIGTVIGRDLKKSYSGRWYLHLPLAIGMPLITILLIGSAFGSFVQVPGVSYTRFLGPGFIALSAGSGFIMIGYNVIEDKKGFIKRLLVAPISRYAILFGYIVGGSLNLLLMNLILITLLSLGIGSMATVNFLLSLGLMILIMIGFYGFGVWFSCLFTSQRRLREVIGYLHYFMMFLSGTFYPVKTLPTWLKIPVYLNPLTYAADALRFSIIGTNEISIMIDIGVLLGFTVLSVLLGTYMFERNLKQ